MRVLPLAALVVLCGLSLAPGARAFSPEFATPERLMQWIYRYRDHAEPLRVPEAVRAMYEQGLLRDEEQTGFLVGFIAGVLHDNPKSAGHLVSRMLPLPPKEQAVIVRAIGYSRLPDWPALMVRFAPEMEERGGLIDDFLSGTEPGLLGAPLETGPVIIYTLWGFYSATGDTVPVRRVISALAWSRYEEPGAFSWEHLTASVGLEDEGQRRAELRRLVVGSTAKWTLVSYAEHHRDLVDFYFDELRGQPEEIAGPLAEVVEAAERFEADRVRAAELEMVEALKRKLALEDPSGSRAAQAGSVGLATACVIAGAIGQVELAGACVVTGALYTGAAKVLGW